MSDASETIVALRRLRSEVIGRRDAIHKAILEAQAVTYDVAQEEIDRLYETLDFEYSMRCQHFDYEDFEGEAGVSYSNAVAPTPVLGKLFYLLHLQTSDGAVARNIEYEVKNIIDLTRPGAEADDLDTPPNLSGWTERETRIVLNSMRSEINSINTKLRDVHTNWKYMTSHKSLVPSRYKATLLGFFGQADHNLPFSYLEDDFRYSAAEYRNKQGISIVSPKWLAPIIGLEKATTIAGALAVVEATARPRYAGEPDSLNHFGSHVTNRVNLFSEPEVIEIRGT